MVGRARDGCAATSRGRRRRPRTVNSARVPAGFSRTPNSLARPAALAAAAALGVLVGLGLRGVGSDGPATALARLAVVALRLRGLPEFVRPDRDGGLAGLAGGLHVAGVAAAWGAAIGAVRRRLVARGAGPGLTATALGGAVLGLAAFDTLLPPPLRLAAGTLTGPEWALLVAAIALAAWFGSRLGMPVADAGVATTP